MNWTARQQQWFMATQCGHEYYEEDTQRKLNWLLDLPRNARYAFLDDLSLSSDKIESDVSAFDRSPCLRTIWTLQNEIMQERVESGYYGQDPYNPPRHFHPFSDETIVLNMSICSNIGYGDIDPRHKNIVNPNFLAKQEELRAAVFGPGHSRWIPNDQLNKILKFKPWSHELEDPYEGLSGISGMLPNGTVKGWFTVNYEADKRYAMGLTPFVVTEGITDGGCSKWSLENSDQHSVKIRAGQNIIWEGPESLEDFGYEQLPNLGQIMERYDEIYGLRQDVLARFGRDYYEELYDVNPWYFEEAQQVRDYYSVIGNAGEYYQSYIDKLKWWGVPIPRIPTVRELHRRNNGREVSHEVEEQSSVTGNTALLAQATEFQSYHNGGFITIPAAGQDNESFMEFRMKIENFVARVNNVILQGDGGLKEKWNIMLANQYDEDFRENYIDPLNTSDCPRTNRVRGGCLSLNNGVMSWTYAYRGNIGDLYPVYDRHRKVGNIFDLAEDINNRHRTGNFLLQLRGSLPTFENHYTLVNSPNEESVIEEVLRKDFHEIVDNE